MNNPAIRGWSGDQPMQTIIVDDKGVKRFRANALVRYLLDHGGIDMNQLACVPCSVEDREQFAQLIGYSLAGFGELSYVREETYLAAELLADSGEQANPKVEALTQMLEEARQGVRQAAVALFQIHPDDLHA